MIDVIQQQQYSETQKTCNSWPLNNSFDWHVSTYIWFFSLPILRYLWSIVGWFYGYRIHRYRKFSSVAQSRLTLWNPMNHSMPGLPIHHKLPESTQTHIHWVSDAIQPSYPLSSPSPPALNLSQHQGHFKWVSS